jgi:hypothetical protein
MHAVTVHENQRLCGRLAIGVGSHAQGGVYLVPRYRSLDELHEFHVSEQYLIVCYLLVVNIIINTQIFSCRGRLGRVLLAG